MVNYRLIMKEFYRILKYASSKAYGQLVSKSCACFFKTVNYCLNFARVGGFYMLVFCLKFSPALDLNPVKY